MSHYYNISIAQKRALSALLARRKGGHGQFGRVLMRKPYRDDDDEGGSGLPSPLEQHPLLGEQPIGAPSDLTSDISARNDKDVLDDLKDRANEASPSLQQTPVMQQVLQQQQSFISQPKPN